jgi:hypothetical protein
LKTLQTARNEDDATDEKANNAELYDTYSHLGHVHLLALDYARGFPGWAVVKIFDFFSYVRISNGLPARERPFLEESGKLVRTWCLLLPFSSL